MRKQRLLPALAIVALLGATASQVAHAEPSFSLDLASPSVPGVSNSALLAPGPAGGPPVVLGAPGSLGLSGGVTDEINALTTGGPLGTLHFSVARGSVGSAGAVVTEAAVGQAAGDIYWTALDGTNALAHNQADLGELPETPAGVASTPPIDELDALDLKAPAPPVLFALAPGHPVLGTAVGCGGDLFISGGAGGFFTSYLALGLASCADAIDALHYDLGTDFYYSLSPGSPSLAAGSPIVGCAAGCSPADIFRVSLGAPTAHRFATASDLGLAPSDDVDALAWSANTIPALGAAGRSALVALLGIAAFASLSTSRRQRRRSRS